MYSVVKDLRPFDKAIRILNDGYQNKLSQGGRGKPDFERGSVVPNPSSDAAKSLKILFLFQQKAHWKSVLIYVLF